MYDTRRKIPNWENAEVDANRSGIDAANEVPVPPRTAAPAELCTCLK